MSDGNQVGPQDAVGRYLAPGAENVKLVYVLYLLGLLVGITLLIGVVMAYLNRGQSFGMWTESHYTYQIRTFWIGLLYSVVSGVLMVVGIGFLLFIAVAIWGIVRCIRGLQWSASASPVPDPQTWIV